MAKLDELSEIERRDLRLQFSEDPVSFVTTILPHLFPTAPPWFHRGILAIFWRRCKFLELYGEVDEIIENFVYDLDPKNPSLGTAPIFYRDSNGELCMEITPFTQVRMPRGFSKTTLCNAAVLHMLLEAIYKFPVYLSYTSTHAEEQLNTVKTEIESNERIHAVWGRLKPPMGQGVWQTDNIDLLNGVHCKARGRGQQIRGMNHGGNRPDCIVFDDVEDRESVKTEEQRKQTRDWAYNDVLPALPTVGDHYPVFVLGTLLHSDSLLITFEGDPRFTTVKFGTRTKRDQTYGSIWPLIQGKIQALFAAAEKVDQLEAYYLEYEGEIRNENTAIFKARYIQHRPVVDGEHLVHAIALDPAISESRRADFAAIVAVSQSLRSGTIWVRRTWAKKGASPFELINTYFDFHDQFAVGGEQCFHGIESIQYQAALIHLMKAEMFRRNRYFEITPITHSTQKDARIRGILQPRYASGVLYHAEKFPELETQLKDYPKGKKDLPDALAMAVALLDPYAASNADPTIDLGDDEYEPLILEAAV